MAGFKGTNGCLEKWKKKYNVKNLAVCGESGDVCGNTVDSWKERLLELVHGYCKENIWNMDKTVCFFKALPVKGFGMKGRQCKGGKKVCKGSLLLFFCQRCW